MDVLPELWDQLTPQQQRYIELLVLQGRNHRFAALEAGYSEATASQGRAFETPTVRRVIAELLRRKFKELDLSAERVLHEVALVAFADPRNFYGPDGTLIPIEQLDSDVAASLQSFEEETSFEYFSKSERKPVGKIKKIRLWNKLEALTLLAKYHKLLVDRVEAKVDVCEGLAERMAAATKRVEEMHDAQWNKEHGTMPAASAGRPQEAAETPKSTRVNRSQPESTPDITRASPEASSANSDDNAEVNLISRLLGRS